MHSPDSSEALVASCEERRYEQAARALRPLWLAAPFWAAWACRQHTCKPPTFGCFNLAADACAAARENEDPLSRVAKAFAAKANW